MNDTMTAEQLAGTNIEDLIQEVYEDAKTTAAKKEGVKAETRVWDTNIVHPVARQGDLYIRRLPLDHKFDRKLKLLEPKEGETERQLAPGNAQGSRHVLDAGPEIYLFEDAGPLEGPVFRAPEGFYLRHPTHGDIDCRLPGTYQVSYPIDKAAEEWDEIRRLRD